MTSITLKAPAKINLWLDIASKRPDGYHNIESVMQTVSLFDELTVERSDPAGQRHISISCSVSELSCDESNLCYRAAQQFFAYAGITDYDVSIHIRKNIPIAAGLAGGSTDAAATLFGLSKLYGVIKKPDELYEIGAKLGADVPFCIRRGISVTRGIGDIFSDAPMLPPCAFLIACEGTRVSTPYAYHKLDEMYDFSKRSRELSVFTALLQKGNLSEIADGMYNIFESAVLPERPAAAALKREMQESGALCALMSGSGPSVFGIYEDKTAAVRALNRIGSKAIICEPYYG